MEKGRIAWIAWSAAVLALICGLAPAASAITPGNDVHSWGASGTTANTTIAGTPVIGTLGAVSATLPGGGGTLFSSLDASRPKTKLSILQAFGGGTPLFLAESPRATTNFAAVENATSGADELWYWNATNLNPVKHSWTAASGEEILEIAASTEGSTSGYSAYAMLTSTGGVTKVYTWGSNTSGRTGLGLTSGTTTNPTEVTTLTGTTIVDIAAGFNFMLAADSTGAVWVWGNDTYSQLGLATSTTVATPTQLTDATTLGGLAPTGVVQVAAAGYAALARTASDIYTWGYANSSTYPHPIGRTTNVNTPTLLGLASCTPVEITAGSIYTSLYTGSAYGRHHAAARCSNGTIYSWGSNYFGEAGTGSTSDFLTTPATVTGISLGVGETILDLDAGSGSTFALTSAGRIYAWGTNYYRQLGLSTSWSSASGSRRQYNTAQLADRTPTFAVDADSRIHAEGVAVAVIDSANVVWTWGYAGSGMVGRGTTGPAVTTTGTRVDRIGIADGVGLARLESTGHGTVAVMSDGSVWTWGDVDNANWSNGDGTSKDRYWPGKIDLPGTMGLSGATVTINDLSCGNTHCLMSTSDGKVYGWGDGTSRQILPTATTTIYNSPTEITTTTNPAQVAAGFNYSLLVDPGAAGAGGTVKAWGQNTRFQAHPSTAGSGTNCALGTGTTCLFSAMQDVTAAGSNVIDISAAYYHSLALRADGALRIWGDNSQSQLGTGSATQLNPAIDNGYGTGRITAVTLPTGEAALSLHTAIYHSLIRTATGKLVGWGTNGSYGVLGNGATTAVQTPAYTATAITTTSPIISVDTFGVGTTAGSTGIPTSQYANQTVAIDATGQVWAWGSNVFGQLGANITNAKTGTASLRSTPQRVQVGNTGSSTPGNLAVSSTSGTAIAAAGWGGAFTPLTTGTAPSAPTIGTATRGNASAAVTWTAPTSPRSLRAYTIVARTSPTGAIVGRAGAGASATSGVITGLTNGTQYHLSVYATNEYGDSAESSQTTATPATTPGAPTTLVAQPAAGGISVSFATPTSDGGDAITGYTITVTPLAGGAATTRSVTVGASPYTESITGLTAGASYSVDVTAANTVGTGTAATVSLVIPGRPSAPQSVSAEPRMGGAQVAWTTPAYDGAVAIASYYIRAYTAGSTTLIAATAVSAANLSAALTGLTDGTAYDITVTAAHGAIAASTDVPASQGVESAAYRLTAGRPIAPTNVNAIADDGEIMLTWSAVADVTGIAVTGYTITYTAGSSATSSAWSCTAGSCASTLTGLVNGTTYSIVVAAVSTAGTGPSSSPAVTATPRSTPGQPASVATSSLDEAIEVTWTAPSSTGGSAITGYDVTLTAGATTVATYSLGADQTSVTADGLTNGTSYVASVSARNVAGSGSARTSAATTPIGAPSAPTNLSAQPNGTDFTVTWSAPSSTGGSAITGYTVVITDPSGIVTEKTVGSAPCAAFSCTVSTLDDGEGGTISTAANTRYTVSVRATNAAGDGPAATDAVVIPGQPSAPRDIIVTDDTSGFHICLLAPLHTPGGAVTAYGISITEDGIDTGLLAVEVASWSGTPCAGGRVGYTVTTLANGNAVQNGSTYGIEVAATSSTVGSVSAYATDAVFGPDIEGTATPYAAPAAPTAVVATAGDGLITMTLTAGSARGRTITNYEWSIDSTNGTDGTWTAFSPAQTNGTFLLTGLTNGTSYTPWLRAVNASGSGTGTSGGAVTPAAPASGGSSGGGSSGGGSSGGGSAGGGSASGESAASSATSGTSVSGTTTPRVRTLTVRTKAKTALAKILAAAGLKSIKGATIVVRGSAGRKVLTITRRHVTARKDGTYTLTITQKPKKGPSTTVKLVLVATKSGRLLLL